MWGGVGPSTLRTLPAGNILPTVADRYSCGAGPLEPAWASASEDAAVSYSRATVDTSLFLR